MLQIKPRERKMVILCILFIMVVVGYQYFFIPYMNKWKSTTAQIEQMKTRLAKARQLQSNPRGEYYSQNTIQNQTSAVASLLENMESWSDEAGTKISNIKPGPVQDKPQVREMSFDVEINGNLESICRLIEIMERPETLVRINKIRINKPRENEMEMNALLTLSTLSLPELKKINQSNPTDRELL